MGRWMLVLLALSACNPYRRALLRGEFVEMCPGGNPPEAWIRFEPDQRFDWSYQPGGPYYAGDDEEWHLHHKSLEISWNNGYAVSTYDLSQRRGKVAPGESTKASCPQTIHLKWVGKRPDAPK